MLETVLKEALHRLKSVPPQTSNAFNARGTGIQPVLVRNSQRAFQNRLKPAAAR